ncbi:MAG TPA: hypothetical protein VMV12_05520 [Candidatus Micrarchaeaceae archaeon]|nr:hypothetical protein [Candidatus Micrarchaeaceae archaeon]
MGPPPYPRATLRPAKGDSPDLALELIQVLKLGGTGSAGASAVRIWVSSEGKIFAAELHASRGIVVCLDGQL